MSVGFNKPVASMNCDDVQKRPTVTPCLIRFTKRVCTPFDVWA